jgi:twitching motility two-component system response regulator PilH
MREMVSEQLKRDGFMVIEAVDGEEAIEKLKLSRPDLVITDIVMPRKNGYELCRWIKNNPQVKDIPVVVCTSKSEEFDIYWGMKQGADAYITKPYHPPDLLATVRHLLRQTKQ